MFEVEGKCLRVVALVRSHSDFFFAATRSTALLLRMGDLEVETIFLSSLGAEGY
jgi:hypothetical protein